MTTDQRRERVIVDLVDAIEAYDKHELAGFPPDPTPVRNACRRLAEIERPPLPEPIEVLMSRSTDIANDRTWPDGWGYAYGIGHEHEVGNEGDEVYRVHITPLERIR